MWKLIFSLLLLFSLRVNANYFESDIFYFPTLCELPDTTIWITESTSMTSTMAPNTTTIGTSEASSPTSSTYSGLALSSIGQ